MRNYVSKVLVGAQVANVTGSAVALEALTEGQIIAFDFDTQGALASTSKVLGFAKGTKVAGEPILSAPIRISEIESAVVNPYEAPVNKVMTLTVTAVPAAGKTAIFKVVYHDNLSIIPNQMKFTTVAIVGKTGETVAQFTARLEAAFDAILDKFVTVSSTATTVVFTGITMVTSSNYNSIDRPEVLNFEIAYPATGELGTYSVAVTTAVKPGQGDPAKVSWLEENAQGRRGYSDRRLWNDTKKFVPTATAGKTYATLVINANQKSEGDMQGIANAPVGVIVCGEGAAVNLLVVDLGRAGVVPATVAASVT